MSFVKIKKMSRLTNCLCVLRPAYTFSLHVFVHVFSVLQSKTARYFSFVKTEVYHLQILVSNAQVDTCSSRARLIVKIPFVHAFHVLFSFWLLSLFLPNQNIYGKVVFVFLGLKVNLLERFSAA